MDKSTASISDRLVHGSPQISNRRLFAQSYPKPEVLVGANGPLRIALRKCGPATDAPTCGGREALEEEIITILAGILMDTRHGDLLLQSIRTTAAAFCFTLIYVGFSIC